MSTFNQMLYTNLFSAAISLTGAPRCLSKSSQCPLFQPTVRCLVVSGRACKTLSCQACHSPGLGPAMPRDHPSQATFPQSSCASGQ